MTQSLMLFRRQSKQKLVRIPPFKAGLMPSLVVARMGSLWLRAECLAWKAEGF